MIATRKILISAYFVIIIVWVLFSIARTLNNFRRFIREDASLLLQSDVDNRHKVYGEIINFCNSVALNTYEKASILFLASGGKPFYFCRYQLYPRQLQFARNTQDVKQLLSQKKFDYLLIYKSTNILENENNSEKWDIKGFNFKIIYHTEKSLGGLIDL